MERRIVAERRLSQIVSRLFSIIALAISNRNTLPLNPVIVFVVAVILLLGRQSNQSTGVKLING